MLQYACAAASGCLQRKGATHIKIYRCGSGSHNLAEQQPQLVSAAEYHLRHHIYAFIQSRGVVAQIASARLPLLNAYERSEISIVAAVFPAMPHTPNGICMSLQRSDVVHSDLLFKL